MQTISKRFLLFLAWSIATGIVLAGAVIGLQHDLKEQPGWWGLILLALMAAVPLGREALRAAMDFPRSLRVIFWILTLAGAGMCLLFLCWQWDGRQWDGRHLLALQCLKALVVCSAILPLLIAALLWNRERRTAQLSGSATGPWPVEAAMGLAWFAALGCIAYLILAKIYVPHICRVTDQQWAAIGRPMPEFEKRFQRVERKRLAARTGPGA
jgi:hypothetical protein